MTIPRKDPVDEIMERLGDEQPIADERRRITDGRDVLVIEANGDVRNNSHANPLFRIAAQRWLAAHPPPEPPAPARSPLVHSFSMEVLDRDAIRTVTGSLRNGLVLELPLPAADYETPAFVLTPSSVSGRKPADDEAAILWVHLRASAPDVAGVSIAEAHELRVHDEEIRREAEAQARAEAEKAASEAAERARVEAAKVHRFRLRDHSLCLWRGTLCPAFLYVAIGRFQTGPGKPWREQGRELEYIFALPEGLHPVGEGFDADAEVEMTRSAFDALLESSRGYGGRPWLADAIREALEVIAHYQPETHRPMQAEELHGYETPEEEQITEGIAREWARKLAPTLRGWGVTSAPFACPHASSLLVRGLLRHPAVAEQLLLEAMGPNSRLPVEILRQNLENAAAGLRPASMHGPGSMLPGAKREATVTPIRAAEPEADAAAPIVPAKRKASR